MSELVDEILQEQTGWKCQDDRGAEWAMRKIAQARMDTKRWKEYYDSQLEHIKNANDATEAFFSDKLRQYFETRPHKVTKTQEKYCLPSGDLVMKKQAPEYKVTDQAAACAWLHNNNMDQYIKTQESVRWADLKEIVVAAGDSVYTQDNGELVPGITVNHRESKFQIKI